MAQRPIFIFLTPLFPSSADKPPVSNDVRIQGFVKIDNSRRMRQLFGPSAAAPISQISSSTLFSFVVGLWMPPAGAGSRDRSLAIDGD